MSYPQPPVRHKPTLRGVSHQYAFFVVALAGMALVYLAPNARAAVTAGVYAASLATLFGASALYHRPTWGPLARQRLRRVDHAAIYLLIAGTYTPICVLALPMPESLWLLVAVWTGAALGVLQSLFWVHAPRWISAALYVGLGWLVVPALPALLRGAGVSGIGLLLAGGITYTVGAVVYALRRPDPLPRVFGYHEVFHALVIAACVCHFAMVAEMVLGA